MPTTYLTVDQVAKAAPELVQKDYVLEISQVNKKDLEGDVTVKETWNWEVADAGWEQLKKQFSELGVKKGTTREERFAALDSLDNKTRQRVDAFARKAIVSAEAKRLDEALAAAEPMRVPVGIRQKGGNILISGLDDGKALIKLLDAAPLVGTDPSQWNQAAKDAAAKLSKYSADDNVYYKISVVERKGEPRILTFAEANEQGILGTLVDKQLEAYYVKTRESDPKAYQNESGGWKSLADVKAAVAEKYYAKTLDAIKEHYTKAAGEDAPQEMIVDYAATLRFYPYVNGVKAKLEKDPKVAQDLVVDAAADAKQVSNRTISDQWKLERSHYQVSRSTPGALVNTTQALAMKPGQWSSVNTPANGDLNFFRFEKKVDGADEQMVNGTVAKAKHLLSNDAQQKLMRHVLATLKDKNAISLKYLNQVVETTPTEITPEYEAGL
jgi:hypothetical protein